VKFIKEFEKKRLFDLVMPKISPSAHTAICDVERFLALQIDKAKDKVHLLFQKKSKIGFGTSLF